mmetsp:Transcript_15260/g.21773  ORF Transcript_15260/g.21773 Transcript_15260/m.21773 type:complete len:92 (+) Transcript_15260:318-593(+)
MNFVKCHIANHCVKPAENIVYRLSKCHKSGSTSLGPTREFGVLLLEIVFTGVFGPPTKRLFEICFNVCREFADEIENDAGVNENADTAGLV